MSDYCRNAFGIEVKKCCASCAHKDLTRAVTKRYCTEHEQGVNPCNVCSLWRMSAQLKVAGMTSGRVKRKEYLTYLVSVREEEAIARQNGLTVTAKSIEQIKVGFEKEFGSIYY